MFRKHEKSIALKAGLLAILVHVLLMAALFISFKWKAAHKVVSVNEVTLWEALPSKTKPVAVEPKPVPLESEPPKPEPEPVPEPPEPEPVPEPEQPKVDIELEKKKNEAEEKKRLEEEKKKALEKKKKLALEKKKKAEEKRKKELAKLQKDLLEEELDPNKKAKADALKKLQQDALNELGEENQKRASAARSGVMDEYIAKIQAKIRGNVNKSLCADGNPELVFRINLLPNGEFNSSPMLKKSSGNKACDDAVERAIMVSEPLPIPKDPDAFSDFRNLNLKFKPNEN